jgi:hypothetical protein
MCLALLPLRVEVVDREVLPSLLASCISNLVNLFTPDSDERMMVAPDSKLLHAKQIVPALLNCVLHCQGLDFSVGLRLHDPHVTSLILSLPFTTSLCTSAKPRPFSLDASVRSMVGLDGSKLIRTRSHVSIFTTASKASCRSGDHPYFFSFLSRWQSSSDAWARSVTKPASC